MDKIELYNLGKELYYDNKYEEIFEESYIKMDDLLDNLDSCRMEIKLLLDEKEQKESLTVEDRIQTLYQQLAEVSKQIDQYDRSEIEKIESEKATFRAKNKYRFMKVEEMEKKYALAIEKELPEKQQQEILEGLKRMRMSTLSIQKKSEKYDEQIDELKRDLVKLEATKDKILQDISKCQMELHEQKSPKRGDQERTKKVIMKKKRELDNLKKEIKREFLLIGQLAFSEGLV